MTRNEALKRVRALLGSRAYWRISDHVTSPERRQRATIKRLDVQFRRAMIRRDMHDRRDYLLAHDAEYQAHLADWHTAQAETEYSADAGYKFEVGTRDGIFVQPRAYGDTWEEIFQKLAQGK